MDRWWQLRSFGVDTSTHKNQLGGSLSNEKDGAVLAALADLRARDPELRDVLARHVCDVAERVERPAAAKIRKSPRRLAQRP
jgi:hypothetical protein